MAAPKKVFNSKLFIAAIIFCGGVFAVTKSIISLPFLLLMQGYVIFCWENLIFKLEATFPCEFGKRNFYIAVRVAQSFIAARHGF